MTQPETRQGITIHNGWVSWYVGENWIAERVDSIIGVHLLSFKDNGSQRYAIDLKQVFNHVARIEIDGITNKDDRERLVEWIKQQCSEAALPA